MQRGLYRLSDARAESVARAARQELQAKVAIGEEPGIKPRVVADGGGLYLQITKSANTSWLFRYTRHGRAVGLGLGGYPLVSLKAARIRASEMRAHLEYGRDPLEEKRRIQLSQKLDLGNAKTFDYCAKRYIEDHRSEWRNSKHIQQWENTIATYASPIIGNRPIGDIKTEEVCRILRPIWTKKMETATRLRGRIESIFSWATAHKFRTGENPARYSGHLEHLLPKVTPVMRQRKHFAALPYLQVASFIKLLRDYDGMARWALEFLILTGARTSEVTGAKWSELDLANRAWTVPRERMKAHREHRVPLCARACDILGHVAAFRNGDFVFPGGKKDKPLSNMAMAMLLRRMALADITVHGFRSTLKDWASETTSHDFYVVEAALAHQPPGRVVAAYMRGDLFDKRLALMTEWEAYCLANE